MISAAHLYTEDASFLCARLQGEWLLKGLVSKFSINSQDTIYQKSPSGCMSNSCSQGKQKQGKSSVSCCVSPEHSLFCTDGAQSESEWAAESVWRRREPIDGGVNRRLMTVEESAGEALQSMKCVKPAMRRELKPPRSLTFLNHSFLRTASSHLSQVLPFFPLLPC